MCHYTGRKNRVRRILTFLCCLAVLSALFLPVYAASDDTASLTAADGAGEVVRVGWYPSDMFQIGSSDDEAKSGYSYEYLKKISYFTGWTYEYVYGEWSELLEMLRTGEIDVMACVSDTPEREPYMLFPDYVMGTETYCIYQHADDRSLDASDLSTFRGQTIGAVTDNLMTDALEQWIDETGVDLNVVYYDGMTKRDEAFMNGEVDAIIATESNVLNNTNYSLVTKLGESEYYLAVTKGRPDLLAELNDALAIMQETDPYFLEILQAENYGQILADTTLTDLEQGWLDTHDTLTIGYLDDYLPFCGTDDNGDLTGLLSDVMSAVVSDLKLTDRLAVEYVSFTDHDSMIEALQNGEIDAIFPVNSSWDTDRENVDASAAAVTVGMDLISHSSYASDGTGRFAVNANNRLQYNFIANSFPNAKILEYDSIEACIEAVDCGDADYTVLNGMRVNLVSGSSRYDSLNIIPLQDTESICLGVKHGNSALLLLLDRGLRTIGSDYGTNAGYSYMNREQSLTFMDYARANMLPVLLCVILAAAILILIFVLYAQGINRARKETEQQLEKNRELNDDLRRAAEASREASEVLEQVHEVLGSAPWHMEYDENGKEISVIFSDALRRLFGYESTEAFPDSAEFLMSLVHPDDRERALHEVYGVLRESKPKEDHIHITSVYRAYRKDGTLRRYRVQGIAKCREDGTPFQAYGVIQDVTELEEAEIGRQEALEAVEAIHDALGSANWQMTFDQSGNMTSCVWSRRFRRMIGYYTTDDFPDELSSWTDLLHPADRKMVLNAYWSSVNDRTGKTVYSVEYRLLTRTKGYRWYSAHGSLTRYSDGTPKIFYGIFLDINDQILSAQSQEANIREIAELNTQLQENQARMEAAAAEQEAQIEEINSLNTQLQESQAQLEEASAETEAQLAETQALNQDLQESRDSIAEAYGMIEGLSAEYHTIWLVNKETLRMRLVRSSGITTAKSAVRMAEKVVELDPTVQAYAAQYVMPEDRERALRDMSSAEVLRHLREEPHDIYTVDYLRRDDEGRVSYHQIAFANADTETGKKQFVLGFRDVDAIVKAEQAQKAELRKAKEEAEAANAAKTSFLFNMSHDIRTPMNAIMGFRALLEKHQEDPVRRADYLRKIDDASTVLLSIINNVLEMARIEKGTLEIDETAWSAEQFNDTLYSVFAEMMAQKGLTFTRQIDVRNPYVFCDPIKLREIFINILSNACKYTNPGGSVHMHLEEIPSDREGYAMYRTTISDTGIGMSEEFLPHLFEEFSREQNTTDARIEGTGLGMPIVKRLVEMLEGTIEVHSRKGEGSVFIVTLPHRIADRAALAEHAGVEIDPKLFAGKRLLLVEDNDLNAEIATEILGEAGFIIDRAEDGVVCLDKLTAAAPGYYDLILMDIQMPRMNGCEAARAIRTMADHTRANIRILAMTANAFEEDKREALRAGMNGHIAKPINVNELMKTLAGMLG